MNYKRINSQPININDINDFQDKLFKDEIVRYIPYIVQNEWQTYKLHKDRKYYIINRNLQNITNLYFLERDYYKYQLERCDYTINIIKKHFINVISIYLKRDKGIGEQLKLIYNAIMTYLNNDKNNYEKKLKNINY